MSPTLLEIARAMAEPLTFRAKVRAMIDEEVRLAVAAEREACREIARQEMLRLQEWEQRPHPDHPDEEEKARGGWMAARAIAAAIRARGLPPE